MVLNEVIAHCVEKWRSHGITLAPPIPEQEVRQVWEQLHSDVSADVLLLYTTIGGFDEYVFEKDFFWSFWPWDWLRKRNREEPGIGTKFCDHSIEIVTWELRYEDSEVSSVWSSHGARSAPSLQSFLESYLDDPWNLL
jgi:hypothetical protein